MEAIDAPAENRREIGQRAETRNAIWRAPGAVSIVYALALAVSISMWFIAIRAPLRQDETGSYWYISGGLAHIWKRQYISLCFPSYTYILWFATKIFGTSEIALRVPSILAMIGAVWLLYLAARELFSRELAFLAAIIFCLHPIVIFESIDVRPYAFAMLATNAAILVVLRLRYSDSKWLAALFGFLAAVILSFHYLFAAILPALLLCFFIVKGKDHENRWRQCGIALATFVVAFLPMLPGVKDLFQTSETHVYEAAPQFVDLIATFVPLLLLFVFGGFTLLAALVTALGPNRPSPAHSHDASRTAICVSLALVPLLILYGISVATPVHMFSTRHQLEAISGIALCWALLIERCLKPHWQMLFGVVLVAVTSFHILRIPGAKRHGITWKYAYAAAEENAARDNAPVLICSSFIESDYTRVPIHSAKDSWLFAQLSYYKIAAPVVPMPESLNPEAIRVGSQFLDTAERKHQRFLAIGDTKFSLGTLQWLTHDASAAYSVNELGVFDRIQVLEFTPRIQKPGPTIPVVHSSDESRPAMEAKH